MWVRGRGGLIFGRGGLCCWLLGGGHNGMPVASWCVDVSGGVMSVPAEGHYLAI